MTTDSFFALTCAASILLMFGFVLAFAGYRFFIFLLPIYGFFWGFGLGAQSIQMLTNGNFLGDIASWVVGFFLGLVFAVLSYIFFAAAVAILAGSLGYSLGVGIMTAIGIDMGLLTWLVGIALAIVFVIGVFVLDIYKWVIIIATSIMGAGIIVGTFLFIFGKLPTSQFVQNPVKTALNDNPIWWIIGIVVLILGFVAQYQSTRNWTLRSYSRWEEVYPSTTSDETVAATLGAPPSGMTMATAGGSAVGGTAPASTPAPTDIAPTSDTIGEPPAGGTA